MEIGEQRPHSGKYCFGKTPMQTFLDSIQLWPRLSAEAKKSLIPTLVERVNLLRDSDGVAQVRIVWRGGHVTETRVRVPVHSLRYSETEKTAAGGIRYLAEQGKNNQQIVQKLNEEGLVPCRGGCPAWSRLFRSPGVSLRPRF